MGILAQLCHCSLLFFVGIPVQLCHFSLLFSFGGNLPKGSWPKLYSRRVPVMIGRLASVSLTASSPSPGWSQHPVSKLSLNYSALERRVAIMCHFLLGVAFPVGIDKQFNVLTEITA